MSLTSVRQSRKNHPLPVMWTGGPQAGTEGTNKSDVNVGSGLDPKCPRKYVFEPGEAQTFTPPPPSDEHPSRGEHGRVSNTSRKN